MDNKQVKALVMGLLSPGGSVMNLNEQNFKFMERNADKILELCDIKIDKGDKDDKKETKES